MLFFYPPAQIGRSLRHLAEVPQPEADSSLLRLIKMTIDFHPVRERIYRKVSRERHMD